MENVKEINFQSSYRFLDTLLEECNKYVDLSKEERASKKEEIFFYSGYMEKYCLLLQRFMR